MAAARPLGPAPMMQARRCGGFEFMNGPYSSWLFFGRKLGWPFDSDDAAVGIVAERRRVVADQLAPPPQTLFTFFLRRGKPILPEQNADLARRLRKRIAGEERQHVRATCQESLFGARDDGIGAPMTERSEPQIPIETGLVGGVDARSLVGILRLEAKLVRRPGFAVIRALELNFIAAAGHYREEAVAVGNAKRLQHGNRPRREWRSGPNHP